MIKHLATNSETKHTYEIFIDGKLVEHKQIDIVFKNGVFNYVNFPFKDKYSREEWDILKEIAEEIVNLEKK